MLSFVAALLRSDSQQYASEFDLQERAKVVFAECDANKDGKLSKQDIYNYLVDQRVNLSHLAQEKMFKQLSGGSESLTLQQFLQGLSKYSRILAGGLEEPPQSIADAHYGTGQTGSNAAEPKHSRSNPASHATMQHATARQMSRLKSTRQLEVEQAEGAERIKAHNLHTAMQPLKQVLYQIDESGSGRMSYHDFYLFLERTSPHMLPAASSIFFTLDRRMDGEVRYKDILRVLYPHALDKELAEMLSVVIPKKHVKGQNNLEQQVAELKEVFAVYDEDGTGQLNQATFVEAIVSAGYEREEAVQMFDIVDADHGGSVSLEEFMDWYLHNETGKDKTGINNQASLAILLRGAESCENTQRGSENSASLFARILSRPTVLIHVTVIEDSHTRMDVRLLQYNVGSHSREGEVVKQQLVQTALQQGLCDLALLQGCSGIHEPVPCDHNAATEKLQALVDAASTGATAPSRVDAHDSCTDTGGLSNQEAASRAPQPQQADGPSASLGSQPVQLTLGHMRGGTWQTPAPLNISQHPLSAQGGDSEIEPKPPTPAARPRGDESTSAVSKGPLSSGRSEGRVEGDIEDEALQSGSGTDVEDDTGLYAAAKQVPGELKAAWNKLVQQPAERKGIIRRQGRNGEEKMSSPGRLLGCLQSKTDSDAEAQMEAVRFKH
ncbi:hypothetical protein WJX82_009797 [Trebouxia sp. C0006]